MILRRQLVIFGIAFALVLTGGIALAAVGAIGPTGDTVGAAKEPVAEPTTTTAGEPRRERQEPKEQPAEEPREEPEEEPEEEPKEQPAEEPKEEPKEEPAEPQADTTPPDFGITTPENGAHTDDRVFTFKGYVEPGATVTRGPWTANHEGEHWSMALVLAPGKNVVGFIATDAAGNVSDATVTLYYEAPTEEPKEQPKEQPKEEPKQVEWSAHQQYGSCGESPPYDVFWGTATPGAKIWIASPYGGKTVEANGDGHWEAKVVFYEVPAGKTFEVVIEGDGHRNVFGFTYTGGGGEGGGEG
jgi:outer membrane biosynthesis protein TonB